MINRELKTVLIVLALLGITIPLIALEVIVEGKVLVGKQVVFEDRPDNLKHYSATVPYYTYKDNIVAIGYADKNVAMLAMETLLAREDQLVRLPATLPVDSSMLLHIKIVADAPSGQAALKMLDNSQSLGEMFNVVNDKGVVIKSHCYAIALKKDGLSANDIAEALNALKIAIVGKV